MLNCAYLPNLFEIKFIKCVDRLVYEHFSLVRTGENRKVFLRQQILGENQRHGIEINNVVRGVAFNMNIILTFHKILPTCLSPLLIRNGA